MAGLTMALLFGTAWTLTAIDFQPPAIPDVLTNAQKDLNKTRKPTISANPQVVQNAEGGKTTTTVTWDAGPAHPNAQVMLKSNNDPQFVFTGKASAGSAAVVVHPGTNLFTLIDSGGSLASVTVTGRASHNTYDANDPNRPHGFINGLQLATPTPSAEADESSSSDVDDHHKKKKKNKHKHHHDDEENQGHD